MTISTLLLNVVPSNQQAIVNLSWSGTPPNGIIDYLSFYYRQGTQQI
jgi:hypothetical protein